MKSLKISLALLTLLSALQICNLNASESPEQILAKAHGLNEWNQVETLEFTFHVNKKPPVNRHWQWNVKEESVTRTIGEKSQTVQLNALNGKDDTQVHKQFINDTFWLLFPFSIVWSSPSVTEHGAAEVEIDGESVTTQKLTATWPAGEGYTPGDAYDLFLTEDNTILGWTFRKANAPKGKFFAWKEPVDLGPIRIYKSYSPAGSATPLIEMRDLRIKLSGDDNWHTAK